MEVGHWNSRAYGDDEHRYGPSGAQTVGGMAIGTPVSVDASSRGEYNTSPVSMRKDAGPFGVFIVLLRGAQIVFSLIGVAVMAANKDTIYHAFYDYYYGYGYYESTLKFSAVKSFIGVLSVDTFVCFYAIVQLVISIVQKATKGSFMSFATSGACLLTFIFDTVLAYALVAAASAAADSAEIMADDDGFCNALPKFCNMANASIAMSYLAFAVMALCAVLYPVRLLRVTKF